MKFTLSTERGRSKCDQVITDIISKTMIHSWAGYNKNSDGANVSEGMFQNLVGEKPLYV